jgi:hypothetical protein
LEDIPADLPKTFNRILAKIECLRGSREYAQFAKFSAKLFRIVAAARRPLTLDELREAVSVEPGETAWNPDQLVNDTQKLVKCCGSLLVIDEENFTVRFIHGSVQQFLCSQLVNEGVNEYQMNLASADLDLGEICVTYLHSGRHITQLVPRQPQLIASSATLSKTIPDSNLAGKLAIRLLNQKRNVGHSMRPSLEDVGVLRKTYNPQAQSYNLFLPYVQEHWLPHTKQLDRKIHPRIWPLWKRLVTGDVPVARLPWTPEKSSDFGPAFINYIQETQQWNLIFVNLAYAKYSVIPNLRPIVDLINRKNLKRNAMSSRVTADEEQLTRFLEQFKFSRHIVAVDIRSANPPKVDPSCSLLHANVHYGYVDGVRLLLDHGVDVNLQHKNYGTALYRACDNGREEIVKLLLDNGADFNLQCGQSGTSLYAACNYGYEKIVKLLLENGADANLQGGIYGTALNAACGYGYEKIVQLLLENGADVNLQGGGNHGTALNTACWHGHIKIVKLLLENGADVNLEGGEYGSALAWTRVGDKLSTLGKIEKLLLEHRAIDERNR